MSLTRMLEEMRNPRLKCKRVGHNMRTETYRYYEESSREKDIFWLRYVAVRVVYEQQRCVRCGHETSLEEVDRTGLHGLTMSDDMWEKMRREGRVRI